MALKDIKVNNNQIISVDNEVKENSYNIVNSNAVAQSMKTIEPRDGSVNFSIQDEVGNAIVDFDNGHIRTKEFDSMINGLILNNLVDNIERVQDWELSEITHYTTEYTYSFSTGGFTVTKNAAGPGHNRVVDLSNDLFPGKVVFNYEYSGTNDIAIYDSKNKLMVAWGTDVTDANIIGYIHPGTGTLQVEAIHINRPFIGLYCNDMQIGKTLTITNTKTTSIDVKVHENLTYDDVQTADTINYDFSISDSSGNNIVEFSDGYIKTKEFDSMKNMIILNSLVEDIERVQDWRLTHNAYTTEYTYSFFTGGFTVTKNADGPGHNRVVDLSKDLLPGKVTFNYVYNGTNDIAIFDSKNETLTAWGTDVTDANIIGYIHPGTGTLQVEAIHTDRPYIGLYCNDMQIDTTLTVTNTITNVKASVAKGDPIYFNTYSSKIDEICERYYKLGEAGRRGYIFITDLHFNNKDQNNKALLRQLQAVVDIANNCQIDFIAIGGDIVDRTTVDCPKEKVIENIRQMVKILSAAKCPVAILTGNHDDNTYHTSGYGDIDKGFYSKNMLVDNSIIPQMMMGGSEADDCYYYFDIEKKNLRVVCLDYIDYNKHATGQTKYGGVWWGFSREQVTWLCSTAFNTDKDIIIFSHGQIVDIRYGIYGLEDEGDKNWNDSQTNKIIQGATPPEGYRYAYYPGYTTDIKNAVLAFNNKSSVSLYGNVYDFSTRKGRIILSHHGHFHADFELNIGNMPVILTGCAKNEPGDNDWSAYKVAGKQDTYMLPDRNAAIAVNANGYGYEFVDPNDRTFETINEALFDVVSVNSNAINILRVGAGSDRVINR